MKLDGILLSEVALWSASELAEQGYEVLLDIKTQLRGSTIVELTLENQLFKKKLKTASKMYNVSHFGT